MVVLKNAVEVTFLMSLKIVKYEKLHTIDEELRLPVTKDIVTCMFG